MIDAGTIKQVVKKHSYVSTEEIFKREELQVNLSVVVEYQKQEESYVSMVSSFEAISFISKG